VKSWIEIDEFGEVATFSKMSALLGACWNGLEIDRDIICDFSFKLWCRSPSV
jgi:hypothetical protein